MKKTIGTVLLVLVAVAGCSTSEQGSSGDTRNDKGLIDIKPGQDAGYGEVTFTINDVQVDPKCRATGELPTSGHVVVVDLTVSTGANAQEAERMATALTDPTSWEEINKDGVILPSRLAQCIDAGQTLPSPIEPNQISTGKIELVVPEASGVLLFTDPNLTGWELHY